MIHQVFRDFEHWIVICSAFQCYREAQIEREAVGMAENTMNAAAKHTHGDVKVTLWL